MEQPLAGDLVYVESVIKILSHLKRIVNLCSNIADSSKDIKCSINLLFEIEEMVNYTKLMLINSFGAFKMHDWDIANELRNQNTTDKILPSCIVCFDNKINENSLLAAKTHEIPILMINRQQYLDLNKQKLEKAKQEFSKSLSLEAIKEIFYRQPYYKIVQDIPNIISIINEISDISYIDKLKSLKYLAFLGQHFIEQSDGYIIDVPVEKYNEQIKGYLQVINAKLQEYNNLIMMEESNNTYSENLEIGTKKM